MQVGVIHELPLLVLDIQSCLLEMLKLIQTILLRFIYDLPFSMEFLLFAAH